MTTELPGVAPAGAPQGATRLPPPGVVPTLTEVLDWPVAGVSPPLPSPAVFVPMMAPVSMPATAATAAPAARLDDEEIVDNVLAAVQAALVEADGPLDQRLREILEPALARFAETLIVDVRADFAAALRDVAAEAVVQELGRYRR